MTLLEIQHIVSSTSQHSEGCPPENLLNGEKFKKWKTKSGEKQGVVILQFHKLSQIKSVDIGNEFSAFIEVLVSRSATAASSGNDDQYQVLVPATSLMSPVECRNSTNGNSVKMFSANKEFTPAVARQNWDRIKIVCTQPFNRNIPFGLSFIRVYDNLTEKPAAQSTKTAPLIDNKATAAESTTMSKLKTDGSSFLGKFKLRDSSDEEGEEDGKKDSGCGGASFFKKQRSTTADSSQKTAPSKLEPTKPVASTNKPNTGEPTAKKPRTNRILSADAAKKENRTITNDGDSNKKTAGSSSSNSKPSSSRDGDKKKGSSSSSDSACDKKKPSSSSTTTTRQQPSGKSNSVKRVPFEELLDGIVFCLSGFQNPLRTQLREKGLELGAKYQPDWDNKKCTHLICAVANTPKYNQVKGRGKIVKKEWLEDCHKQKKRLSWRGYAFERKDKDGDPSEDELDATRTHVRRQDSPSTPTSRSKADSTASQGRRKDVVGTSEHSVSMVEDGGSSLTDGDDDFVYNSLTDNEEGSSWGSSGTEEMEYDDDDEDGKDTDDEIREAEAKKQTSNFAKKEQSASRKSSNGIGGDGSVTPKSRRKQSPSSATSSSTAPHPSSEQSPKKKPSPGSSQNTGMGARSASRSQLKIGADGLPILPDFFEGFHVMIYGNVSDGDRKQIRRFVTAFGGQFENYMNSSVTHVVSEPIFNFSTRVSSAKWDENFDDAKKENKKLVFVGLDWVLDCGKSAALLDTKPYLINRNQ